MKTYLIIILLIFGACQKGLAQNSSLVIIDEVTILNENKPEALFYYQNNWVKAREIAKANGYIKEFYLLQNENRLLLVTILENELQSEQLEENFKKVFQQMPPGPQLLNDKEPAEFREVTSHRFESLSGG